MKLPRLCIAGTNSNAGKTTIVCALLGAFKKRGLAVAPFKCGPDYIDPLFHQAALGLDSRNLDSFLMGEEGVKRSLQKNGIGKDLCLLEGVMGYYDGIGGLSTKASAYDIARLTDCPVVLALDCKGMSVSAAAVIKGFLNFRQDSRIAGVILNRVSPMLVDRLRETIEKELSIKVYGYLPENPAFSIGSRHLGLLAPGEVEDCMKRLELISQQAENTIDVDGLLQLASMAEDWKEEGLTAKREWASMGERDETLKAGIKIAVARDEAFFFYYSDNLDLLKETGCEIVFFSPLHDAVLPDDVQGVLLGGGYPEIYGEKLSKNKSMRQSVYDAICRKHLPVIAECGGFLYLHDTLEDDKGQFWPMVGAIPGQGYAVHKLVRFGYYGLTSHTDGLLPQGEKIPAHGFHYWDSTNKGADCVAEKPLADSTWHCGHNRSRLWAGFSHVHFYGATPLFTGFLKACQEERAYG